MKSRKFKRNEEQKRQKKGKEEAKETRVALLVCNSFIVSQVPYRNSEGDSSLSHSDGSSGSRPLSTHFLSKIQRWNDSGAISTPEKSQRPELTWPQDRQVPQKSKQAFQCHTNCTRRVDENLQR